MRREFHLLQKNDLPGEIEIHTDLLSSMPSALSRKRAEKVGNIRQKDMDDPKGAKGCILCHPDLRPRGANPLEVLIDDKVACFGNDYPYLPADQRVIFLWNHDEGAREQALHKTRISEVTHRELYWLLLGAIKCGQAYRQPEHTYDLMRMVCGLNLGRLAGQSQPHVHLQYGWEVALHRRSISPQELDLYFEELNYEKLILFESHPSTDATKLRLVVPWTPKGQFAVDLYFTDKYQLTEMGENDIRAFAFIGEAIIQRYRSLGIKNLNIVFSNSPYGRKIEPLTAHFVPRVNVAALYEISGVNVVDTPPSRIVEEFRSQGTDGTRPWSDIIGAAIAASEEELSAAYALEAAQSKGGNGKGAPKVAHTKGKSRGNGRGHSTLGKDLVS